MLCLQWQKRRSACTLRFGLSETHGPALQCLTAYRVLHAAHDLSRFFSELRTPNNAGAGLMEASLSRAFLRPRRLQIRYAFRRSCRVVRRCWATSLLRRLMCMISLHLCVVVVQMGRCLPVSLSESRRLGGHMECSFASVVR
jgi:hypothetical protein